MLYIAAHPPEIMTTNVGQALAWMDHRPELWRDAEITTTEFRSL